LYLGLEADHVPGLTTPFAQSREDYPLDYLIGAIHLVRAENTDELWFIDGPTQHYEKGLESIFHGDIRRGVDCYFQQLWDMLEHSTFDLLAHADKIKMNNRGRYFSTADAWYQDYILQTVDLIAANGCVVEVNTRGLYKKRSAEFYPSVFMLQALLQKQVAVTLSTDAHHPSEIGLQWKEAMDCLLSVGYRSISVLTACGWKEQPIGM
jgi:histidinol-phosphatase (PHP family)